MPTDKQLISLCYSILKQLELKHIDWKIVAADNGISNPHAARMRYSRFKTQMERGASSAPKPAEKRKRAGKKGGKGEKSGGKDVENMSDDEELVVDVKRVKREGVKAEIEELKMKGVKSEDQELRIEDVKPERLANVKMEIGDVCGGVKMQRVEVVKLEDEETAMVMEGMKYREDPDCVLEKVRRVKRDD